MLTDFFFSIKSFNFSKRFFSNGKWTEIQKLQIHSCSLWGEKNFTHQICKIYQNIKKKINWLADVDIYISLFNCLKSSSWETSLNLAAIQVEYSSSLVGGWENWNVYDTFKKED